MPEKFKILITDEHKPTDDGRLFPPGVLTWQQPGHATPLMMKKVKDENGHSGGEVAGFIDHIWRDEENKIWGEGMFSGGDAGRELAQLVAEGLTGTSIGAYDTEYTVVPDEEGRPLKVYTRGKIREVTVLPVPASEHTRIAVVTASAIPLAPPVEWFQNPGLKEPTMLTVTPEGRIYGHVASWTQCHVGYQNRCVMAPRSKTNYKEFNNRPVLCADGSEVLAGPLTFGVGHAGLEASARRAKEHYDNVNAQIGQIVVGEDAHGIWMAGALNPDVDEVKLRKLRASAVSGDWRNQDLTGVLVVNIPGFPVPRAQAKYKEENQLALVAAGVLIDEDEEQIIEGDEMSNESDELTFDSAIAEFASTLENIVASSKNEDCVAKSKEVLSAITASVIAPEKSDADARIEELAARLDEVEKLTKKNSTKIYKRD